MTYFAYLDEFGHVGPYVARDHLQYKTNPVFGLAGFVLPADEVRGFGTWFFRRKCELLHSDIERSGEHPARWEKKGSSLYTVNNVKKYRPLRDFTNRLLNKIEALGGFVFYVGTQKIGPPQTHNSNGLYASIFEEAIKRIDQFCADCDPPENFALILDEHQLRSTLITQAVQSMYRQKEQRRYLIEPPFQVESHRYQTLQAADWIAGLVGRLEAIKAEPTIWPENEIFHRFFGDRVNQASRHSGVGN